MKIAILTGGFDPITAGHLEMFEDAQKNSDFVLVFANSDAWLTRKKGKPFMDQLHRITILNAIQYVDVALPQSEEDDKDNTSCEAILKAHDMYPHEQLVFMNGGDRNKENIPEMILKNTVANLEFKFGIGGTDKNYSSSWLLRDWKEDLTERRWGHYKVLSDSPGCKVKELYINPGKSISLQLHYHREEHWVVVEGEAMLELGYRSNNNTRKEYIFAGCSVTIHKQQRHKITNCGTEMLKIVEVQTGAKLIEEDIVRFEEINEK